MQTLLTKLLSGFSLSSKGHDPMWLVIGLGNPGSEYEKTRHNIGFMLIDQLAADYKFPVFKEKFQGLLSQGQIGDEKVMLLKPQTYMNNSGESVQKVIKFYQIPVERILVAYDEIDLPFLKTRVKAGGGAGGHNGIKSLDQHLPSKEYWRLRLGVGHPGDKAQVKNYVLHNFSKAEAENLPKLFHACSKTLPVFLAEGKGDHFASKLASAISNHQ